MTNTTGAVVRNRDSTRARSSPLSPGIRMSVNTASTCWSWSTRSASAAEAAGTTDSTARVAAEQERQLVEGRPLVVDEQHPHACTPGAYFGTRSVTFVPAPGAVSTTRP